MNIRQAAEQTAAGTGQLEKATASLNALGQQLRKSVERYKI
jgi:methyl-accepting chemotaxis protein